MESAYRYKILFLDDAFLLEVHNLRRRVNPVAKHPEPIFQLDAPWDRDDDFHDLRTTVGTIASPMVNRGMAGWLIGSMILSTRRLPTLPRPGRGLWNRLREIFFPSDITRDAA